MFHHPLYKDGFHNGQGYRKQIDWLIWRVILSSFITSTSIKTVRNCFYFHNGDNCNLSYLVGYKMFLYLFGLTPLIKIGFHDCYHHGYSCNVNHYWCYIYWYYSSTESSFAPIQFAFVAFAVKFESTFGWIGCLHSTFE